MVSEFNQNPEKFNNARIFIEGYASEQELQRSLNDTKHEAEKHQVNEVAKKWVEEWNAKNETADPGTDSRREFICSSLNDEHQETNIQKKSRSKTFAIRIALLSAAAMIATLLLVKTLRPTANPEYLYTEYYKPLNAYSFNTRNGNTVVDRFSDAVELYKQGQYNSASTIFSDLMIKEPNVIANRFFKGITLMELGDYDQAIILLSNVISSNGEYKKEAQWYLGLVYLKTGETKKATSYFNELAKAKGYYQSPAQDLLNRLK